MPETLLAETFQDFEVGHLPYDYTPLGEYHYRPPQGYRGSWYEPTNRGWRLGGHWAILEEDGQHYLEQTTNTNYISLLVAGDTRWTDYTIKVVCKPLLLRGEVGVMFRYDHGRAYYALMLKDGTTVQLIKKDQDAVRVLAQQPFMYDCDTKYALKVEVRGDTIAASVNNECELKATDQHIPAGKIGVRASVPAAYYQVTVEASPAAYQHFHTRQQAETRQLAELAASYPRPKLWKKINLKGFGAGRHIRFGDLNGDGQLEMVLAQNIMHSGIDLYSSITCLTALTLDGKVLWQYGRPRLGEAAGLTTSDLAFQIYDIDGDGFNEVICTKNFRIVILDGRTGKVKKSVPTPVAPPLTQETCFKWPESDFHRINGDAILIANFTGKDRPSDILIKNRYNFLWAYDSDLNPLWRVHTYTGHFPQPYDFNGDGRDELLACWTMIDSEGKIVWDLGFKDHVDEIAIGHFNPSVAEVQIALVAGDDGFLIITPDGKILHQDKLGHAQRLTVAKFREDLPGLQFYVVTYWDNAGIISLHDCQGQKILDFEPTTTGNILNPINWTGQGTELALLSGSRQHGGLIDGHGRKVVSLPDDGHPELAAEVIDVTGDARDELVVWDLERMYIYTQDKPFAGESIYTPRRYPHYNNSNYRAEISLPQWTPYHAK